MTFPYVLYPSLTCIFVYISLPGIWVLLLSGLAFFSLCTLLLYVSCQGVTNTKSESDGQTPNNTQQIKDEKVEFVFRK